MKRTWVGAVVAAVVSCSAHAGEVNWSILYGGTVDQSQMAGLDDTYPLFHNMYGWDRNVSAWQSFQAGVSGSLGGIGVQLIDACPNASVDLNIYAGEGVQGTLLESTHLSWTDGIIPEEYPYPWYTFLLDTPVELTVGSIYTFSFENPSGDTWDDEFLRYVVAPDGNPYPNGNYMQQGYFWGAEFGYTTGSTTAEMNFQTVMGPITVVPEPASVTLLALGFIAVGVFIRRRR